MPQLEEELNEKGKRFGKVLIYSILGIFFFYTVLSFALEFFYPHYKMVISGRLLFVFFLVIAFAYYLISKAQNSFLSLYKWIVFLLLLLVTYLGLYICHKSMAIGFFYIPILLLLLILTNIKTAASIAVFILIICLLMPTIAEFLDISHPTVSSAEYLNILKYLEYIVLGLSTYLSILIFYYYSQFVKINIKYLKKYSEQEFSVLKASSITKVSKSEQKAFDDFAIKEDIKYATLYREIMDYMEHKKAYQQPNFNKRIMAKDLQTNETYISKALFAHGKSFSVLVNEYRINQVKNAFANKDYQKFTIEHIYTKAGFMHQTTFNRVFKECTGTKPSEYIDKIDSDII